MKKYTNKFSDFSNQETEVKIFENRTEFWEYISTLMCKEIEKEDNAIENILDYVSKKYLDDKFIVLENEDGTVALVEIYE